jgi:hypothetical protein
MEEHKTGTFSASRDCLQILATWGCALSWGDGSEWMARQWASWSCHGFSVHSKCHCQVKTLVRMTSNHMSFPETVSDSLCRISLVVRTNSFFICPNGCLQTIPQVKKPDVAVLGWRGYTWSAVVRLIWTYCQIL